MMQIYSNTKKSKKTTDSVKAKKRRKMLSEQEPRKMLTQQEPRKMLNQQNCGYLEEENTKNKQQTGTEKQGTECQGITLIH